jgi:hypothetical protein
VLSDSRARVVFCEDGEQAAKIAQIRGHCPLLEYVVTIDVGTLNPHDAPHFGTIGRAMPGCEIRIAATARSSYEDRTCSAATTEIQRPLSRRWMATGCAAAISDP